MSWSEETEDAAQEVIEDHARQVFVDHESCYWVRFNGKALFHTTPRGLKEQVMDMMDSERAVTK